MVERQGKHVSERMREWAKAEAVAGSTNRARFLLAKPDIEHLLSEGWSARKIWRFLQSEGRIEVVFSQFAKDLKRLVTDPGMSRPAGSSAVPIEPASTPDTAADPRAAAPEPAAGKAAPTDPPATADPQPRPKPKRFQHPESPDMKDYV